MLSYHRDQENVLHSRNVNSKQAPTTPGVRHPKTPLRVPLRDENIATGFHKTEAKNTIMTKGTGAQQALKTPLATTNRAPLRNKTTNVRAKIGQSGGEKHQRDVERSQARPTTAQKSKQNQVKGAPVKLKVMSDVRQATGEDEEPEYAPLNPEPLPYVSDVLPEGGLTYEGLRPENLFKGFYQHFHDPLDDDGVSKKDREFQHEIQNMVDRVTKRNEDALKDISWNSLSSNEPSHSARLQTIKGKPALKTTPQMVARPERHSASTITARRAASALGGNESLSGRAITKPTRPIYSPQGPFAAHSNIQETRAKPLASASQKVAGEIASRTTIGYNKGKSAAALVHRRKPSSTNRDKEAKTGIKPAVNSLQPASTKHDLESGTEPTFLAIFDPAEDEEDLPVINAPEALLAGIEEDDFELLLDI